MSRFRFDSDRRASRTKRVLIGRVGVDSGQLMIVDPCYLKDWKDADVTSDELEQGSKAPSAAFSYLGACEASCSDKRFGLLSYGGKHDVSDGDGQAAVTSTGYGDGNYPVYANVNSEGRVMSISVSFA